MSVGLVGLFAILATLFVASPEPQPTERVLNVSWAHQAHNLSCEAAALKMALSYYGIDTDELRLISFMSRDSRPATFDTSGHLMRWGDAVLINDPWFGRAWHPKEQFESAYRTFADMAIVLGAPNSSPLAGRYPAWPGDGACLAPTHRLEAIEAVHRSRARRDERHLRRLAAVRADHVVHDPRAAAAVAVRLASRSPAFRATPGLVLQPA